MTLVFYGTELLDFSQFTDPSRWVVEACSWVLHPENDHERPTFHIHTHDHWHHKNSSSLWPLGFDT